jgi:peptidyl-prolyl cis-trans isomerase C
MKKFLVTAAFIAIATTANAEILAKVNGKPITRQEVERSLAEVATMENGEDPKLATFPLDFQKAFIDKYIEKLLIVEEARRAGVHKDAEIISEVKSYEDNLLQQKYLTDLVIKQRTDKKLRDIYNNKFKTKEGKQEVHASHILVKTEEEAKKIKRELDRGADFDVMADKYSIDPGAKISSGDLGYFTADEKVEDFSQAAFALKKGETSGPVKTEFGWHIIKVYDKRRFSSPSYAQAISDVEGALATEVIDNEVNKLKKTARVEYLGQFSNKPAIVKKAPLKSNNIAAESALPEGQKVTIPAPKPVAATKPAEIKPAPVAATKPVEKQPAKVDIKPVAESKPAPKAEPAKPAAPNVTATPVQPASKQATKPTATTPAAGAKQTATVEVKPVVNTNLKSGTAIASPVQPAANKTDSAKD